jgi:TonB family protein
MRHSMAALAGALATAAVPSTAQRPIAPAPPPSPPPITIAPTPPEMLFSAMPVQPSRQLLVAVEAWKEADAARAAAAYAAARPGPLSAKRADATDRQFISDWIVALTYSNPVAAQAKLDEWNAADPQTDMLSEEALRRLVHQTRIALRTSAVDAAAQAVATRRRLLDEKRAALTLAASQARKAGKRVSDAGFGQSVSLGQAEQILRASEFLVATSQRGEAAFAEFSGAANPFRRSSGVSVFINGRNSVSCASAGLKPDDWMIAEVAFERGGKDVIVLPYAQSRDAVLEHFLSAIPNWGQSYQGRIDLLTRQHLFVRCTKSAPPPTDTRPDIDYLFALLGPRVPSTATGYKFNPFRDQHQNLVIDKQWGILIREAASPNSLAPYAQRSAQAVLLAALKADAKPDPVAIAIVSQWSLPEPEVGRPGSAKSLLPLYQTALAVAQNVPAMPPRVIAYMEFKAGELHEKAGDAVAARALYSGIAVRGGSLLPEKSPEVIKASLRLAGIADADGKKAEADAIITKLGMSPEQCSIYQAKPAITKMPEPQYPGFALREEMQGSVAFEFDLSDTGAPTNFRVITSAPPFVFDSATVSSFAKASFAPATRGGDALACEAATQAFVWKMPEY